MSDLLDIQDHQPIPAAGKWLAVIFFWGGSIIGSIAMVWMAFDPTSMVASEFVRTCGFLTIMTASVFVHELGHFYAGRAVGVIPVLLKLGFHGTLFELRLKRVTISFGAIPFAGKVERLSLPPPSRRAAVIFTSGGPLANVLLLAAGVIAIKLRPPGQQWFDFVLFYTVIANLILLVVSLIPRSTFMDGVRCWTDGKQLLEFFLTPSTTGSADSAKSKTITVSDDDPLKNWSLTVACVAAESLLAGYRFMLNNPEASTQPRTHLLDAFATTVLMFGHTTALPEADRYSRELLDAKPDEWTIKGTRGSVLVELGEIESGFAMLLSVYENSPSTVDKAISAAYLGIAEFKGGNRLQASEWCRSAAAVHPNFPILKRLQELLRTANSPT
jgi:Zn-dependent protease